MVKKLTKLAPSNIKVDDVLTLDFDARQKSRFSAITDNGVEIGVFLTRGQILRSGMIVTGTDSFSVLIKAAAELVSVMRNDDSLQFSRACYHLGNRHVSLQILEGELRYLSDHVLDHMLEGLGLTVAQEMLPFEPEAGAYHKHEH
jgi:urease accessory protein